MKKLIVVLLILIILGAFTSCNDDSQPETIEPFEVVLYEEDTYGYPSHKILFHAETEKYHEYIYYYSYDGCYRNLARVDHSIYDSFGRKINPEE